MGLPGQSQYVAPGHAAQLKHWDVPPALWQRVEEKLANGVFDIEDTIQWRDTGGSGGEVVALRAVPAGGDVWVVPHSISAPTGWQLLNQLQHNLPLCLQIMDDIQATLSDDEREPNGEETGSCIAPGSNGPIYDPTASGILSAASSDDLDVDGLHDQMRPHSAHDGDGKPGHQCLHHAESLQARVFRAVRRALHRHVFMVEALGCGPEGKNVRVRYVMDRTATRMRVSAEPCIQIAPFMTAPGHGGAAPELVSILWPVQDLTCGQPLMRGRLPLGLADYASREFWMEQYRCERAVDDWYCDATPALLRLVDAALSGTMRGGARLLVAGCGNSALGVSLLQALPGRVATVLNIDYVQEVVGLMAARFPPEEHPGLCWVQADLTDLGPVVSEDTVDLWVDKATLDGLATADAGAPRRWAADQAALKQATSYLHQAWRVLRKPTGRLLIVSLRPPAELEAILHVCTLGRPGASTWRIEQHQPSLHDGATCHAYLCAPMCNE